MIIYKITSKRWAHEALNNGAIRIGLISYYKQFEDKAIGDISEGLQPYLLSSNGSIPLLMSGEEADRVFKRSGFSFSHDWKINLGTKGKLLVDNCFNTFIFCCSHSETDEPNIIIEFGDSFYIIKDPDAFAHEIAQYIGKEILPRFKTVDGKIPDRYYFHHQAVNYQEKVKTIADTSDIPDFTKRVIIDEIFTKDINFKYQKEYRFVWFFYYSWRPKNEIVSFGNEPSYIDVRNKNIINLLSNTIS